MQEHAVLPGTAARGRLRGFLSQPAEVDDVQPVVAGKLPEWLRGHYLMNGPAVWDFARGRFEHWFDGLAKLHRFEIGPGGVRYRSRLLRSEALAATQQAQAPRRGGFGTPVEGGFLSRLWHMRDPVRTDNGAVVMGRCEGQWWAQTESDRVTRFDAQSLETRGELPWPRDGIGAPLMAAHSALDGRGRWWNAGAELGRHCHYVLFSAGADGRRELRARIPVGRPGYLHAIALTERRAVIWECAWRVHPLRLLFSSRSYREHFDWLPEGGSRFHVIDLADGQVRSWDAPPLMAFHASQAFDRGADTVIDLCLSDAQAVAGWTMDRLRSGAPIEGMDSTHQRFVLAPGAASAATEPLPGPLELPQSDPRIGGRHEAAVVWGAGGDPSRPGRFFSRTLRVDLRSGEQRAWSRGDAVCLEPLFVPEPGAPEGQGVLLVPTLGDDDEGSVIAVLDAQTLEERARMQLPCVIPFGFHAAFEAVH